MKTHIQPLAETALNRVSLIMRPLIRWLIRSGVGYADFIAQLKIIFHEESVTELNLIGEKQTVSALSVMSGLHRKDVKHFLETHSNTTTAKRAEPEIKPKISMSSQVITRWLTSGIPLALLVSGERCSFEALVKTISTDVHPATLLTELKRLGLVAVEGECVILLKKAFTPDASTGEAHQLFADSVHDHLWAGVTNLSRQSDKTHLEQSVFADGLTAESIVQLEQLSNELWKNSLNTIVEKATILCAQDKPLQGMHRFRLGMFSYTDFAHLPKPQPEIPARGEK